MMITRSHKLAVLCGIVICLVALSNIFIIRIPLRKANKQFGELPVDLHDGIHDSFKPMKLQQVVNEIALYADNSRDIVDITQNNVINLQNDVTLISKDNPNTVYIDPWNDLETGINDKCRLRYNRRDVVKWPLASVVITYHSAEVLDNLIRTVHSVLTRTPPEMLQEVLLVDDGGNNETFTMAVNNYLQAHDHHSFVTLHHNENSQGLIQARSQAVQSTTGKMIVFLDSHMEVLDGWLEPLTQEIALDYRTVASSYLDWIRKLPDDRWQHKRSASSWTTVWDWDMSFQFQDISDIHKQLRKHDITESIPSATIVGCAYAISRDFWNELGGYDNKMKGWGAENIHISIKAWMCGGRVVYMPCSHVCHLEKSGGRLYRSHWKQQTQENYHRLVLVWMDQYKKQFYQHYPHLKNSTITDVADEFSIKRQCSRNMTWYLKNVIPQLGIVNNQHTIAWGGLINEATGSCLTLDPSADDVHMKKCHQQSYRKQNFYWSLNGQLRLPLYIINVPHHTPPTSRSQEGASRSESRGVSPESPTIDVLQYNNVYTSGATSRWLHVKVGYDRLQYGGGLLQHKDTKLCLETFQKSRLHMTKCNSSVAIQKWSFQHYSSQYSDLLNLDTTWYKSIFRKAQYEFMKHLS